MKRWLQESNLPADVAIAVARAYGTDPLQALVACGWLTLDEVAVSTRTALVRARTSDLTAELHERVLAVEAAWLSGREVSEVYDYGPR